MSLVTGRNAGAAGRKVEYVHSAFEDYLATITPNWQRMVGTPDYHKLYRAFTAGYNAAKKEPPPPEKFVSKRARENERSKHYAGDGSNRPSTDCGEETVVEEAPVEAMEGS